MKTLLITMKTKNTEVTILNKSELIEDKDLPFDVSSNTDNAKIGSSLGFTINMGGMEFLRCDVSVSVPCSPTQKNIDMALEYTQDVTTKEALRLLSETKGNAEHIRRALHDEINKEFSQGE